MVLQMAFDFDLESLDIRPGWLVLGAGLCVVAVDIVRARQRRPKSRSAAPARVPVKPMQEVT